MTSIVRADLKDYQLLSEIGKLTLLESHGHSASPEDINSYVTRTYDPGVIKEELSDPGNIYHIIYDNDRAAGYSKMIFNTPYPESQLNNTAKLERIYLLKEFYGLKLGLDLLQFNIDLAKRNDQAGIWLHVWKENPRAVNFYQKNGFRIVGNYDFKVSETHSNPNHRMFLSF